MAWVEGATSVEESLLAAAIKRSVGRWEEAAAVVNGGLRKTGRWLLAESAGCKSY